MTFTYDDYALYYQTKTPIGFWCRWKLNIKFLIQPIKDLIS